jgi:hypothetical protein
MKNKTFAIPAEAAAIPPKPSTAAIRAIIRNVTAQPNIFFSPPFFKNKSRQLLTLRVFWIFSDPSIRKASRRNVH